MTKLSKEELVTLEVFGAILDKPCYFVSMTLGFDNPTINGMIEIYSKLYYKAFCYKNHLPYNDNFSTEDYVRFMKIEKNKEKRQSK